METLQSNIVDRVGITDAQKERVSGFVRKFRRNTKAEIGLLLVAFVIVVAIFAPLLAPYPMNETNMSERTEPPSLEHPMGTDDLGRDIFSRIILGSRISLYVGFGSIMGALIVGSILGVISGYSGGLTDELIMRLMDAAMSFPPILLALTLLVVLGPDLQNVIIALAFVYTPQIARVARSAALAEKNEAYVESAVSRGENSLRIIFSEIFPNTIGPLLVQASLTISFAILAEASLSFLGLGAQPPRPSWGVMIDSGRGFMETAPWMIIFPAVAIGTTVVGFNLLGDGLRDVLDPKVGGVQ